jgi:hypothetical protein
MKRGFLIALLACAGCGAPRPRPAVETADSHGPKPTELVETTSLQTSPPRPNEPAVEAVAMSLLAAFQNCDKKSARAIMVSFDELVAVTTHVNEPREDYDHEVDEFLDQRCKEFSGANVKFVGAKVMQSKHLLQNDDPERLKRDVDIAFVRYLREVDGTPQPASLPFSFLRTDHGFKFSLHQ